MEGTGKVSASEFYTEYHGHKVNHLSKVLPSLRASCDSLIWTAGDSSLDNKYWFRDTAEAVGAYQHALEPPISKCDVTYWLNYLSFSMTKAESSHTISKEKLAAINTAVEATTLNQRSRKLLPQDVFLRENIKSNDVLIVSIGGNDVALFPTPCTILSMAGALCLPTVCVENTCTCYALPCNDYCCGCGPSLFSCPGTFPPCLGYFRHLFGVRIQNYIEKLTLKTKPKKILVCMIYYLDEKNTMSWAGPALSAMGYNSNPKKLQLLIKKIFEQATSNIKINGSEVIPIPFFDVLDGKITDDYIARVEPSVSGGRKLAEFLLFHATGDSNYVYKNSATGTVSNTMYRAL